MRIQHNIMAMSAYRNYTNNVSAMKKNLEKLSSGYKINRAGDDAAGLAISEKMRAQITGLETAQKNAKDGISLVQTAEGALTEVHDMLNRMVELATQSANGTYDDTTDRAQMQKELNQLRSEINRIADSSNFNGIKLLDGTMSSEITGVVTSDYTNTVTTPGAGFVDAGAVTWNAASAVATDGVATVGNYVLHDAAGTTAPGQFTIDLSQLTVTNGKGGAGNAKNGLSFNIKIGDASTAFFYETSSAGTAGVIANAIANASKGLVFTVSSNGTAAFMKASNTTTKLAANTLVYKAVAGTDGTVTFKAHSYITAGGATGLTAKDAIGTSIAASKGVVLASDGSNMPKTITKKQSNNFHVENLDVKVSGSRVTNNSAIGVVKGVDTTYAGVAQYGQTAVAIDPTKLNDGAKITIGLGSGAKTMYIKKNASSTAIATSVATSDIIDLTTVGTTASAVARAISNAFGYTNQGIEVGANGSKVVLYEHVASGVSAATSDVQTAMETVDGFKKLLTIENPGTDSTAYGNNTLTIDPNRMRAGQTLEINTGNAIEKFQFVASAGASVASGATAIVVGSQGITADQLRASLAAKFTNASVAVADGKVTIKFTDTASATYANATGRLLTGESGLKLQIGDTADDFNQLVVEISDMHTDALGIDDKHLSIAKQDDAAKAVDLIKNAINQVSDLRGTLGATQNRLDHTINNLSVMTENIQDAESTIRDVDIAEEMMAYTKNNILIQSAQAMLAQANQVPQGVLQLLG